MREFRIPFLLLFLFSFFLFNLTMSGHLFSQDGEILYRTSASFWNGDRGAVPPLAGATADGRFDPSWGTRTGQDGREYPQYGIGQPLLAAPFYGIGRPLAGALFDDASRFFDFRYQPFRYHEPTTEEYVGRFAIVHFNQVITALSVALLGLFCARLNGSVRSGAAVGLLYAVGTIAWVHSRTFFTEPLAGLCVLLAYYLTFRALTCWDRGDKRSRRQALVRIAAAGLAFGHGLLTRPDTLVFLPGPCMMLAWRSWTLEELSAGVKDSTPLSRFLEKAPLILAAAAPVGLCVGTILWLNYVRYGSIWATGYSDQPEGVQFSGLPVDGFVGLLLTPGKSLFLYSPTVLVGLAALGRFYRRERRLAAGLLAGAGAFLYFEAAWQNWEGGWCWGPRHIVQLTPLLLLPTGALLFPRTDERPRWAAGMTAGCLAVAVLIQILGLSVDFIEALDRFRSEHQQYQNPLMLTIYSLRHAPPVLHLNLLLEGRHDLFWIHYAAAASGIRRLAPLAPLLGCALSSFFLLRLLRKTE